VAQVRLGFANVDHFERVRRELLETLAQYDHIRRHPGCTFLRCDDDAPECILLQGCDAPKGQHGCEHEGCCVDVCGDDDA